MLQILTKINPENAKFKWTSVEQKVFEEIKQMVFSNVFVEYPKLKIYFIFILMKIIINL